MLSRCLPLALMVALTAAPQANAQSAKPIIINNDRGGNVVQMMMRRGQLESSGRQVQIRGYCRSACTMLITMRNACLAPDATVGFHAPRIEGTNIIPPLVDEIMASTYRNGIRTAWETKWRSSLKMVKISAREYKRLDPQTRLCGQKPKRR